MRLHAAAVWAFKVGYCFPLSPSCCHRLSFLPWPYFRRLLSSLSRVPLWRGRYGGPGGVPLFLCLCSLPLLASALSASDWLCCTREEELRVCHKMLSRITHWRFDIRSLWLGVALLDIKGAQGAHLGRGYRASSTKYQAFTVLKSATVPCLSSFWAKLSFAIFHFLIPPQDLWDYSQYPLLSFIAFTNTTFSFISWSYGSSRHFPLSST